MILRDLGNVIAHVTIKMLGYETREIPNARFFSDFGLISDETVPSRCNVPDPTLLSRANGSLFS